MRICTCVPKLSDASRACVSACIHTHLHTHTHTQKLRKTWRAHSHSKTHSLEELVEADEAVSRLVAVGEARVVGRGDELCVCVCMSWSGGGSAIVFVQR